MTRRPDKVLQLAAAMPTGETTGSNWARNRLDVADAQSRLRQYGDTVDVITEVHEQKPEWLASNGTGGTSWIG